MTTLLYSFTIEYSSFCLKKQVGSHVRMVMDNNFRHDFYKQEMHVYYEQQFLIFEIAWCVSPFAWKVSVLKTPSINQSMEIVNTQIPLAKDDPNTKSQVVERNKKNKIRYISTKVRHILFEYNLCKTCLLLLSYWICILTFFVAIAISAKYMWTHCKVMPWSPGHQHP